MAEAVTASVKEVDMWGGEGKVEVETAGEVLVRGEAAAMAQDSEGALLVE